jgi:predicted GNAT family acetyltransferase
MNKTYSIEKVDWQTVAALFAEVNWGQREPSEIQAAFQNSSHVIFIYDEDELVAFGRTMDDGRYYAMLVDVVVKPAYQQSGLGREVVTYLQQQLVNYNFITLTAAPGKEDFYLKLGWQRQKTAMILPVSDKQRQQHT